MLLADALTGWPYAGVIAMVVVGSLIALSILTKNTDRLKLLKSPGILALIVAFSSIITIALLAVGGLLANEFRTGLVPVFAATGGAAAGFAAGKIGNGNVGGG